ncbi:MAG: DUF5677 domain-containing protein [Candidatus Poribacteria bacterium]|nr:DUF5677 domain-containing protein [Candidatus Poribacteria bacterium]
MNNHVLSLTDSVDLSLSEQVEAFYASIQSWRRFAKTTILPIITHLVSPTERDTALCHVYYRMYGWIQALEQLNGPHYFLTIGSSARSLFELSLDLNMLSVDSDGSAVAKFHGFSTATKYKAAKNLVDLMDSTGSTEMNVTVQRQYLSDNAPTIDAHVIKLWGKNKNGNPIWPDHWSGLTIADRARACGAIYEVEYRFNYVWQSWLTHSGSTGTEGISSEVAESCVGVAYASASRAFGCATEILVRDYRLRDALPDIDSLIETVNNAAARFWIKVLENQTAETTQN